MNLTKCDYKTRLTVTIDKEILAKAKEEAKRKHIPLSRVIENFLSFFINPEFHCFMCGTNFPSTNAKLCAKCGWMICPECKACRCGLSEETAIAIFHMRSVYEKVLAGRVKQ